MRDEDRTFLKSPALPNCRIFQVNQGVSNETYSGFLCAPDGNRGGWWRLTEMVPGDVILHNRRAKIVAVSVVEPMAPDDERLVSRKARIRQAVEVVGACLRYEGDHLSIDEHPETRFLACLISTVMRDVDSAVCPPLRRLCGRGASGARQGAPGSRRGDHQGIRGGRGSLGMRTSQPSRGRDWDPRPWHVGANGPMAPDLN